jgi:hypothetical protein
VCSHSLAHYLLSTRREPHSPLFPNKPSSIISPVTIYNGYSTIINGTLLSLLCQPLNSITETIIHWNCTISCPMLHRHDLRV